MCNGLWACVFSSMFRKHLDLAVCLSLSLRPLCHIVSESVFFRPVSVSVCLSQTCLCLSLSQSLCLSVVIMFVHCSHCVFLCILLGCLTHKLWLSNCVSMKRSYSVCFTPALRLRPLLSGGIWVTLQQGQSFQGMIFCFGTPTLFWRKQTSDFCLQSVSRDSAAGILWVVEQQGSFLRRESVQNKVFEYFPWQVFSVYLYVIYIYFYRIWISISIRNQLI